MLLDDLGEGGLGVAELPAPSNRSVSSAGVSAWHVEIAQAADRRHDAMRIRMIGAFWKSRLAWVISLYRTGDARVSSGFQAFANDRQQ